MGCSGSRTTSNNNFKYCVTVDGPEHSNFGLNKIVNENFKKGNKLYLLHIYNPKKFLEMPSEMLPENLIPAYEKKISEKLEKKDYEIIKKEKPESHVTVMESVLEIASGKNVDLLVVGAVGHKGIKKSKNLTKGLQYLVSNCKIPCLAMKHHTPLENKEIKGNNWLICIKDDNIRSFRSLEFCKKMINKQNDTIIGLHFSNEKFLADKVKSTFESRCKADGIKNKMFIVRKMDVTETLGKNILDYLIFGQELIEYVVVNHNIHKYKDLDKCPTVELIKYGQHNIIFCRE